MHFSEGLGDPATPKTAGDSKHCTEIISSGMHKGTCGSDYVGSALWFRDAMCNGQHC